MASFNWPDMFTTNGSKLIDGKQAARSNLLLLLNSNKCLFGDPEYGINLKKVLFEPGSHLIVDLLIDELYVTIQTFMPQLWVERKDITITCDKYDLRATIKVTYLPDNTTDLYEINLTNNTLKEG